MILNRGWSPSSGHQGMDCQEFPLCEVMTLRKDPRRKQDMVVSRKERLGVI